MNWNHMLNEERMDEIQKHFVIEKQDTRLTLNEQIE